MIYIEYKYMFSLQKGTLLTPLIKRILYNTIHHHNTRNVHNLHVAQRRTNIASKRLRHKGPDIWNQILEILETFSYHLKKYIVNSYQIGRVAKLAPCARLKGWYDNAYPMIMET